MAKEKFDRDSMSMSDLKKQPITVVETELNAFAKTIGIKPSELFRSLNPGTAVDAAVDAGGGEVLEACCHSDSW